MVFVRERGGGWDDGDFFLESEGGLGEGCAGNVDSRKSCQRKFGGVLTTAKRTYWNTGTQSIVTASLLRYAVMACARILDKAAKREDCSVAWMMGDGAMVGRCCCRYTTYNEYMCVYE